MWVHVEHATQRGAAPLALVIILYFTACRHPTENVSSNHDDKASATGCSGLITEPQSLRWNKQRGETLAIRHKGQLCAYSWMIQVFFELTVCLNLIKAIPSVQMTGFGWRIEAATPAAGLHFIKVMNVNYNCFFFSSWGLVTERKCHLQKVIKGLHFLLCH